MLRYLGSLPQSIGKDIELPLPQNPDEELLVLFARENISVARQKDTNCKSEIQLKSLSASWLLLALFRRSPPLPLHFSVVGCDWSYAVGVDNITAPATKRRSAPAFHGDPPARRKKKWFMQPSLRGKVATCKDHRIGEMSVIDIATSTGELPHYPTAARRRRSRCHCGGGRRAAGEQSGGPADQEAGGGSFAKPDTFCELTCPALVHAPYDVAVCCERRSLAGWTYQRQ